jgi:hypothetical protein
VAARGHSLGGGRCLPCSRGAKRTADAAKPDAHRLHADWRLAPGQAVGVAAQRRRCLVRPTPSAAGRVRRRRYKPRRPRGPKGRTRAAFRRRRRQARPGAPPRLAAPSVRPFAWSGRFARRRHRGNRCPLSPARHPPALPEQSALRNPARHRNPVDPVKPGEFFRLGNPGYVRRPCTPRLGEGPVAARRLPGPASVSRPAGVGGAPPPREGAGQANG